MTQTITPYLLYADVEAALDFLSRAFGFEERLRYAGAEGYVNHAEMRFADGVIMLGDPGDDYRSPREAGHPGALVCVTVDDVDAHYRRASAAGAEITEQPADQAYGERRYAAVDPEGHRWFFAQPLRDVALEEWGATVA
jgi:PhnB protein